MLLLIDAASIPPMCTEFYLLDGERQHTGPSRPIGPIEDRNQRRGQRYAARRGRWERHGLTPGLEVHTA